MSSPIEKYKAELQSMLKFDEKAAIAEYDRSTNQGCYDQCLHMTRWQHTKTAKIAQALLDAVEALEFYANPNNWTCDEGWDGYLVEGVIASDDQEKLGAEPPFVGAPTVGGKLARETLDKLSKGDE